MRHAQTAITGVLAASLLVVGVPSVGRADSTPPPPSPGAPGKKLSGAAWCWEQYFARPGEAMKLAKRPPATTAQPDWVSLGLPSPRDLPGPVIVSLRAPPQYTQSHSDTVLQLVAAAEPLTPLPLLDVKGVARSYDALLQVRFESGSYPVADVADVLIKNPGGLFPSSGANFERPATVSGRPAREFCTLIDRSPGHATLVGGKHIPLPFEREMVHGYYIALERTQRVVVFYRVPHRSMASLEPSFAAILETLTLSAAPR